MFAVYVINGSFFVFTKKMEFRRTVLIVPTPSDTPDIIIQGEIGEFRLVPDVQVGDVFGCPLRLLMGWEPFWMEVVDIRQSVLGACDTYYVFVKKGTSGESEVLPYAATKRLFVKRRPPPLSPSSFKEEQPADEENNQLPH